MLDHNFFCILIDFFLEDKSPVRIWPERIKLNIPSSSQAKVNYTGLIKTLSILIKHFKPKSFPKVSQTDKSPIPLQNLREVSAVQKKFLYSYEFWLKLFIEIPSSEYFAPLVVWASYENELLSEIICVCLLRVIFKAISDTTQQVMEIVEIVLKINDSLSA